MMTNLIAQNKDLQQLYLKMKKKHFRFFGGRTLLLLQLSLDKSSPIFLQQGQIIQYIYCDLGSYSVLMLFRNITDGT